MEVVGGIIRGDWLLRLVVVGFSVVGEGRKSGFSLGVVLVDVGWCWWFGGWVWCWRLCG